MPIPGLTVHGAAGAKAISWQTLLKDVATLQELDHAGVQITDAGIAALKQALPAVNIVKGWTAADFAKLTAKPEEKKPVASPKVAAAQKKLDDLNAEIAKRRETRTAKTPATPEWEAANKAV